MPWYMVEVERWIAQVNNLLNPPCARCAALHGQLFDRGEGPAAKSIHRGCRCNRIFDHIRYTEEEPRP